MSSNPKVVGPGAKVWHERPWQRFGLIVAVILPLPLIMFGLNRLAADAFRTVLERSALHSASESVSFLSQELPDVGAILSGEELSAAQKDVLNNAVRLGDLFSLQILDRDGRVVILADPSAAYKPYSLLQSEPPSQAALDAYESGAATVSLLRERGIPGYPLTIAEAFIPARSADGDEFVAKIRFNETEKAGIYGGHLRPLAIFVPLVCAGIYLLPTAVLAWVNRRSRRREDEVRFLYQHDTLSGLLNRQTFTAKFQDLARASCGNLGVLCIDIDRFKTINEEYGNDFGDAYLGHVSKLLVDAVRDEDLVGRLGGDEFVIAVVGVSTSEMSLIAERIVTEGRTPFVYGEECVAASLSAGWHIVGPEEDHNDALHAAGLALSHAKVGGRGLAVQYFNGLDAALRRRRRIEDDLRLAIDNGGVHVAFQPLVAADDGRVVGFEALTRLTTPTGETIPPNEFIPVAEDTGMIHEIGVNTLRAAAETAMTWPEHIFVSVNLSPAQFTRVDMADRVAKVLEESGLPASRLELEITESLLLGDEDNVASQLLALKQLGVSIAMDDFGTGYSSLGYLWKYKFDKLKVDRVFLEAAAFGQANKREIIETIIVLGHKMGMDVTVEGVETDDQLAILSNLDCDQHQGFYYGRPMPAEETSAAICNARPRQLKTEASG